MAQRRQDPELEEPRVVEGDEPDVPPEALLVRDSLDSSDDVDASRIEVVVRRNSSDIVLRGWVSTPEEVLRAPIIAEQATERVSIVNMLQVDPNLRAADVSPQDQERTVPAENEVLVGSTDMLAGPDSQPASEDMDLVYSEHVPWEPPDSPTFPGEAEGENYGSLEDEDDEIVLVQGNGSPAAADLSAAELASGRVPSLDPEAVAPQTQAEPAPRSVDELGRAPDDETLEPMVEQVPGTAKGPGAIGEHAQEGGSTGAEPAPETGAIGADTRSADPARMFTGTVAGGPGAHRGPQSREDPALREEMPEPDEQP